MWRNLLCQIVLEEDYFRTSLKAGIIDPVKQKKRLQVIVMTRGRYRLIVPAPYQLLISFSTWITFPSALMPSKTIRNRFVMSLL